MTRPVEAVECVWAGVVARRSPDRERAAAHPAVTAKSKLVQAAPLWAEPALDDRVDQRAAAQHHQPRAGCMADVDAEHDGGRGWLDADWMEDATALLPVERQRPLAKRPEGSGARDER